MKINKQDSRHFLLWKWYVQGAPWKKQYCCFFSGAPNVSRKFFFFIWNVSRQWQIKISDWESRHFIVWKYYALSTLRKKQHRCFFREAPKNFQKKLLLHMQLGWIASNQNKKSKIRTLYILEILYPGCSAKEAISLLPSLST